MEITCSEFDRYKVELQSIRKEATDTYTFFFTKPNDFEWDEGVCVKLANSNFHPEDAESDFENVRHLTIVTLPQENAVAFTTRIRRPRSAFKNQLLSSEMGTSFYISHPESKMALKRVNRSIVLISSGVSIATMRPLIKAFANDCSKIPGLTHLHVDSSSEFIYQQELDSLAKTIPGLQNYFIQSRPDFYSQLDEIFNSQSIYYLVGSDQFIIALGKKLLEKGININSLILDKDKTFYSKLVAIPKLLFG